MLNTVFSIVCFVSLIVFFIFEVEALVFYGKRKVDDGKRRAKLGLMPLLVSVFCFIGFVATYRQPSDTSKKAEETPFAMTSAPETTPDIEADSVPESTPVFENISDDENKFTVLSDEEENLAAAGEDALKSVVGSKFEDRFEIDRKGKVYTISVWNDGVAAGMLLAKQGNTECLDLWTQLVDAMNSSTTACVNALEEIGLEDPVVIWNVLNDYDHSKVLFSSLNGITFYDAVHEQE